MTSPPQRNSTPSKSSQKKTVKDDHFNFEDFLKLDLPPSVNCSREIGTGKSRFSQWFGRDKLSHSNGKFAGNGYDGKTAQQFFDYHRKATQKKMNVPNKLRSVNELEADWCPPPPPSQPSYQTNAKKQKGHVQWAQQVQWAQRAHQQAQQQAQQQTQQAQQAQQAQQTAINTVRMMINQLATAKVSPAQRQMNPAQMAASNAKMSPAQQRTMNAVQSNFLLSLINKRAENLYQYRMSQNAIMERPDAQLLFHRLVNGQINKFHILQQINNPTIHQRDRETLLTVFAFWNENQQRLIQQR